jgi:catechol 2,3-dioxygenase-like lactoylglutathione lyase family enzyme
MQLDGVHHIGVNVQNLDRAEKFYTEVLGFRVAERYSEEIRHLMLDTGSTTLHLFKSPALEMQEAITRLSDQGYAHIAFGTCREKFPQIIEELKNNKIKFRGPLILGKGESIHFKDPDGNHLEIRCPAS